MATATSGKQLAQRLVRQAAQAPLFVGGLDAGQSTALLKLGEMVLQIPSYVGTGDLSDLLSTRLGSGSAGGLRPGEYVIEVNGAAYFVGELALAQALDATTQRGDTNRYHNGHTKVLLYALVGAMFPQLSAVRLRLFTGLPIQVYRDQPGLKGQVRESLEGEHFYTIHDERGVREMHLIVECVGVVMEGVAAAKAFGPQGKPMLINDIGGGSFDVAYLNAQGEVVDAKSGSLLNNGSERIGELLSTWFRAQYGRALTALEIAEVLANYLAGRPTTIYEEGAREVPVDQVERVIGQVRSYAESFLSRKLGSRPGSDTALALVIGGAARFIQPKLYAPEVKIPDKPERYNVEAYAFYAEQFEKAQKWPIQVRG